MEVGQFDIDSINTNDAKEDESESIWQLIHCRDKDR